MMKFVERHMGLLNFFIFQWFFVRLAKATKEIDGVERTLAYFWMRWPVPMTGWFGIRYRYVGQRVLHRVWGETEWMEMLKTRLKQQGIL